MSGVAEDSRIAKRKDSTMTELKYIEFHVIDICNLNCNGCSHFSPLVQKNTCTLESFERDIRRLSELFDRIDQVRLLGGEPFLEAELKKYVMVSRAVLPDTDIRIVTNALLIPNIDPDTLRTISENNVSIDITLYPPTYERRFAIKEALDRHGIRYSVSPLVTSFRKRFCPDHHSDINVSFARCAIGKECTIVDKGELALCYAPFALRHYNSFFETELECTNSTVDIHNPEITAQSIVEFLSKGNDSCKYCGILQDEPWSQCASRREIDPSHWVTNIPFR